MKKTFKADLILISGLVLLAVLAGLFLFISREKGAYATVYENGQKTGEYPLSENAEIALAGGKNILFIENGAVYMKEASCPDRICIRTGKISCSGESIICLPNKTVVTIEGKSGEADIK